MHSPCRERFGSVEFVGGEQDRGAGKGRGADDLVDIVTGVLIEAGVGLVQEPQRRAADHQRSERGTPTLAGRQSPDGHVAEAAGEPDAVHRGGRVVARESRHPGPEAKVVGNGEFVVEARRVPQQSDHRAHRSAVQREVHPQHLRSAGCNRHQARATAQQRGLAGPVGSGDEHDLAGLHVEIHAGEGGETTEERDRGAEVDDRLHGARQGYRPGSRDGQAGGADTVGPMFHRVLGGVGRVLITIGVVILLFVAFQLWGTSLEQSRHQDALATSFGRQVLGSKAPAVKADEPERAEDAVIADLSAINPTTVAPIAPGKEGSPIGIIEIPRIGLRKFFVEGVAKADLKKGPGHYPGTPLPGQAGNAAIAGHRTTYGAPFNRIDELLPGDPIYVYTMQGKFRYEVMAPRPGAGIQSGPGWFSVKPRETYVIAPTADNRITLTACHPKRSAAQRIVVQARLAAEPAPAATTTTVVTPSRPQGPDQADSARAEGLHEAEASLGGDAGAKWPAIAFAAGFAALYAASWFAAARWRRWWVYAVATPGYAVLLWFCFLYADRWLPSI